MAKRKKVMQKKSFMTSGKFSDCLSMVDSECTSMISGNTDLRIVKNQSNDRRKLRNIARKLEKSDLESVEMRSCYSGFSSELPNFDRDSSSDDESYYSEMVTEHDLIKL